jgi:hypothetical protein
MRAIAVVAAIIAAFSSVTVANAAWGPETPPFNLEVILRDVAGGRGFGLVTFRQPNDADKIVYLDTWVRDLSPDHDYVLQRAVDTTLDGACTSQAWLDLGEGLQPKAITTDGAGRSRVSLFRSLAALATGAMFDIHFRVIDAVTRAPVLASACYRYTVDP